MGSRLGRGERGQGGEMEPQAGGEPLQLPERGRLRAALIAGELLRRNLTELGGLLQRAARLGAGLAQRGADDPVAEAAGLGGAGHGRGLGRLGGGAAGQQVLGAGLQVAGDGLQLGEREVARAALHLGDLLGGAPQQVGQLLGGALAGHARLAQGDPQDFASNRERVDGHLCKPPSARGSSMGHGRWHYNTPDQQGQLAPRSAMKKAWRLVLEVEALAGPAADPAKASTSTERSATLRCLHEPGKSPGLALGAFLTRLKPRPPRMGRVFCRPQGLGASPASPRGAFLSPGEKLV